jgi:hypothetical protein
MLRWPLVDQSVLVSSARSGPKTRFVLLWDICGSVDVERPLWWEKESVVYNCCWPSPAQSFSGPSPAGLITIFYCLRFETPPSGVPGPRIYISHEQGGPVVPPGTGFPFHRLLRLAGLRWRYSNPPPHGLWLTQIQSQNCITTDGQSTSLVWCQAPIWGLRQDFISVC